MAKEKVEVKEEVKEEVVEVEDTTQLIPVVIRVGETPPEKGPYLIIS